MGRPLGSKNKVKYRKRVIEEPKEDLPIKVLTKPEDIIADYLARSCGIPGCIAKFHQDDADKIILLLSRSGLVIKRG